MKYILDASVALKWVLVESDSPNAIRLRNEALAGLHEFIAPNVFPLEIAHSLTRAERKGLLKPGQGRALFGDILTIPIELQPSLPLLVRAMNLSSATLCGVYDGLYIALSEQTGCELITADQKLAQKLAGFPVALLSSL